VWLSKAASTQARCSASASSSQTCLAAVGCHADQAVADDADDPGAAFLVEGQAVGEGAGAELGHGLASTQRSVGAQAKRDSRRAKVSLT
jgi:hypothetical protein